MTAHEKAVKYGGCTAQLHANCYKEATRHNVSKWQSMPSGFIESLKIKSGVVCERCIYLAKKAVENLAAMKSKPQSKKRCKVASPYRANPSPAKPPEKKQVRKVRTPLELLDDAYRKGEGRHSEPVNYDGPRERRGDDDAQMQDPLANLPEPPQPPPAAAPPARKPTSPQTSPFAVDYPDWWPVGKGKNHKGTATIRDVPLLRKMVDFLRGAVKEMETLKKTIAELHKVQEACWDATARAERLETASARAAATGDEKACRARAKMLLESEGLNDFAPMLDWAVANGILPVAKGSKRIFVVFVSDAARNMAVKALNAFRYHPENALFWATVALVSPRAASLVRGPGGLGTGTSACAVSDARLNLGFGVPSEDTNRATIRGINPDDDGTAGLKPSKIAAACLLGKRMFTKMDATDIRPKLGEKRGLGEDGRRRLVPTGDADLSEFTNFEDPVKKWAPILTEAVLPAQELLGVTKDAELGETGETGTTAGSSMMGEFLKSVRTTIGFLQKHAAGINEKVAATAKEYQDLQRKFTARQQKTHGTSDVLLHWKQWSELMSVTKRQQDLRQLEQDVRSYLVEAAKLVALGPQIQAVSAVDAVLVVAQQQITLVPRVTRVFRRPATLVMAVMMHACDHSHFTCVGRFYVTKDSMTKDPARDLVRKVEETVRDLELGEDVPRPILHGCGADGEFSHLLNGTESPTNLSQLADEAVARHARWKETSGFAQIRGGLAKGTALHERWRELRLALNGCALPRRPCIMGFGEAMSQQEKKAALEAYRVARLSGRKLRGKMAKFIGDNRPEDVLYCDVPRGEIPADELVLLDALRALLPAEAETDLEVLARQSAPPPGGPSYDGKKRLQAHVKEKGGKFVVSAEEARLEAAFYWVLDELKENPRTHARAVAAMTALCDRAEMDYLRLQFPGFASHYYVPPVVDGHVRLFHECFHHKLKNCLQGLQGQELPAQRGDDAEWPLVLPRLLSAARSDPPNVVAEALCVRAFDKQWDLPYAAFVSDESFKRRLLEKGHVTDALVLDILCESFEAWSLPGLTAVERSIRLFHFAFLSFCLWGEQFFLPSKNTGAAFKKRRGLTADNLLAMHANVDGIVQLLASLPDAARSVFVERCLSNVPDLENYFSLLVQKCGYKPDCETAEAAFRNIDAMSMIKAAYDKPFHINQSKNKHYDWAELAKRVVDAWNNGSKLDPNCAAYLDYVDDMLRRTLSKVERRTRQIREMHKV